MYTEHELRDMLRASADRATATEATPDPAGHDHAEIVRPTPLASPGSRFRGRKLAAPIAVAAATVVLAGAVTVLARQNDHSSTPNEAGAPTSRTATTSAPPTSTPPARLHQATTPVLDLVTVKPGPYVENLVEPEGEDLHGQQLVSKWFPSNDRMINFIVAPKKGFSDKFISKSHPVEIAGTTGHYAVIRLFPLAKNGKGGSPRTGTIVFHTPDGRWAFAYLQAGTKNNTQQGTPVNDASEIVAAYDRLGITYASGTYRTPLKLKYLPAQARFSEASTSSEKTSNFTNTDLTFLDDSKQMMVSVLNGTGGWQDGTNCMERKSLGCFTRLHRTLPDGRTLLVDGIAYPMSETKKVFDNVELADLSDPSTYFNLAEAVG